MRVKMVAGLDGSAIDLPNNLAVMLVEHKLAIPWREEFERKVVKPQETRAVTKEVAKK